VQHLVHSNRIETIELDELRPTQITVGYAEVEAKRSEWSQLSRLKRREALKQHLFPAVIGPKRIPYIVDHHHLGLALREEGIKTVWVSILDDLSWLEVDVFWRTMEFRSWTHPYDANGNRRDYRHIPKKLTELSDDPYRSLAGLVRSAGGFAKSHAPFAEFLWADYFRTRVRIDDAERATRKVISLAVDWAHAAEARYLPGWASKQPSK
jgi:hypothetical protein